MGIKPKPTGDVGGKLRDFTGSTVTTKHTDYGAKKGHATGRHFPTRRHGQLSLGARDNPVDVCLHGELESKRPEEKTPRMPIRRNSL